jgi:molecular chaperone GrpE (heat shock protein)
VENNHVVEEYQRGYVLHDRLIRPAMVQVCRK